MGEISGLTTIDEHTATDELFSTLCFVEMTQLKNVRRKKLVFSPYPRPYVVISTKGKIECQRDFSLRKGLLKKAKGILKVGASLLFPADISGVVDQRQREERGARIMP